MSSDRLTRTETVTRLLEELDLYLDRLDLDHRGLLDQLQLLACKIDDANGLIMELEQQSDTCRTYLDGAQDNGRVIAEILESLGHHALPEDDDEEQPAA